jgi:hypothetical protein
MLDSALHGATACVIVLDGIDDGLLLLFGPFPAAGRHICAQVAAAAATPMLRATLHKRV